MKVKKKTKLLNTMIVKRKLDEMTNQFVLLNHTLKQLNDNNADPEDSDDVALQMAELYADICNLVDRELREQNPNLNSLFDCLIHLKSEIQ